MRMEMRENKTQINENPQEMKANRIQKHIKHEKQNKWKTLKKTNENKRRIEMQIKLGNGRQLGGGGVRGSEELSHN